MLFYLIPEFVIPYLILVINCYVFKLLRIILFKLTPSTLRNVISEFISTLELCSDCAELNVVWEFHGNIGYGIALFLLCLWWCDSFEDAEACPCGPVEDVILLGTTSDSIQKLLGQMAGAYVTWKYTNVFWCWHLMKEHQDLHEQICYASLQVPMYHGAVIEAMITFISRIVYLESYNWNNKVANYINSIVTVILVLSGN